jgi:hypothetical protein
MRKWKTSARASGWCWKAASASLRSTRSAATERRYLDDDGPRELAAFRDRRAASLDSLVAVAPSRLTTVIAHARTGGLSGLDILAAWVEHDRLHLAQLAAALARTWATRWAPLHTEYAGPIPYAG